MNWFLIGFSGSGKTTLGKRLAESIGYDFWDLDALIEEREKQTITEIFEQKGEPYFRNCETFYLKHLPISKYRVVATGGGTPCFNKNIDWMKLYGKLIYIKADEAILFDRLTIIKNNRPLLNHFNSEELKAYISIVLKQREPCYEQADFLIESNKDEDTSLKELLSFVK